MADEADEAQGKAEAEVSRGIAAARARTGVNGSKTCIDCALPIAPARRKANPSAKRCIDCQEAFESGTPRLGRT